MSNVTATLGGTPTSLTSVANVPPVDTIVISSKDHQFGSWSAAIQAQLKRGGVGVAGRHPSSTRGFSPRRAGPTEDPVHLLQLADSAERRKASAPTPLPPFNPNIRKQHQENLSQRSLGIPPSPPQGQLMEVLDERWTIRDDEGPIKCAPVTVFDEERFSNYIRQQRTVLRHTHSPRRIQGEEFVPPANINTHRRGDLGAVPQVTAGSVVTAASPRVPAPPLGPSSPTSARIRTKASDFRGKQDLLESLQPQSMRPPPIHHKRHHLAVLTDFMTQAEREKLAAEIRHELHKLQIERRGQQFQRRRAEHDEKLLGSVSAAKRSRNDSTDATLEDLAPQLPTELTFYTKNPDCNVRGKEYLRLPVPNSHGIRQTIAEQATFLAKAQNPYNLNGAKATLNRTLHDAIYPDFKGSVGASTAVEMTLSHSDQLTAEVHTGDTTSDDDDETPADGGAKKSSTDSGARSSPRVERDPSRAVVLGQLKAFTAGRFNPKTGEYRPPANHPTGSVTGVLKATEGKPLTEAQLSAQRAQGVRAARRTSLTYVQRMASADLTGSGDPNLERTLHAQRRAEASRRDAPFLFNTQAPTAAATSHSLSGVSFSNNGSAGVVPILEGVLLFSRMYEALNGSAAGTPGLQAACKEALLLRLLDCFPTLVSSVLTKRAFVSSNPGAGSAEITLSQFIHVLATSPHVKLRRVALSKTTGKVTPPYTLGSFVPVGAVVSLPSPTDAPASPATSRMLPGKAQEITKVVRGVADGGSATPRTVRDQQKEVIASRRGMGSLRSFGSSAFLPAILDSTATRQTMARDDETLPDTKFIYPDSMLADHRPHSERTSSPQDVASVRPWESVFRLVDSGLSGIAPRELFLLGAIAAAAAVPTCLDSDPTVYRTDVVTPTGTIRALPISSEQRVGSRSPVRSQSSVRTDRHDTMTYTTLWAVSLLSLRNPQDSLPLTEAFAIRDALKVVADSEARALEAYRRGRQSALLLAGAVGGSASGISPRRSPPRAMETGNPNAAITAFQRLFSCDVVRVVENACDHVIREHRLLACGELADALLATLQGREPTYGPLEDA